MKTLIENSIKFKGRIPPTFPTIFTIDNEAEKNLPRYRPLTKMAGKNAIVTFDYLENGLTKFDSLQMTILNSSDEFAIKTQIIYDINAYLVN